MKLIVGLGNIGKKYENTRHNIGFMVLDSLKKDMNLEFKEESKFKGSIGTIEINNEKIIFLKPSTFMNSSGESVISVINYYKILAEDVLVIYDDLDLDTGVYKFKKKGSSGGQKGMESIINSIGHNKINRIKIGIGSNKEDVINHVLGRFSREDQKLVDEALVKVKESINVYIEKGMDEMMNTCSSL